MKITFKLNDIQGITDNAIKKGVAAACIEVEKRAVNFCPVDTGNLRKSITRKVEGKKGYVFTNVKYAADVEYGTKPHVIKPKTKKYLVFKTKDGKWHKVKSVKHPGFKGKRFMRRALFKDYKKIIEIARKVIKQELS